MRNWKSSLPTLALALLPGLFGNACAFGEVADRRAETAAALGFLFSLQPRSRGEARVLIRFGDGGTDGFDTFTAEGNAVVLSGANWIEFEKIELVPDTATAYSGTPDLDGLAHAANFAAEKIFSALNPVSPLYAHGESGTTDTGGKDPIVVATDFFVEPLSAGNQGTGRDSLDRYYFQADEARRSFGTGTITRVKLHIRRFQFSGTVAGNAFAVLKNSQSDLGITLACHRTVSEGGTLEIPLYFNMAELFHDIPSADAAGVTQAFEENASKSDLVLEHEC